MTMGTFYESFEREKSSDIKHYGVKGMRWGVINEEEPVGRQAGTASNREQYQQQRDYNRYALKSYRNDQRYQSRYEKTDQAEALRRQAQDIEYQQKSAELVKEAEKEDVRRHRKEVAKKVIGGVAIGAILAGLTYKGVTSYAQKETGEKQSFGASIGIIGQKVKNSWTGDNSIASGFKKEYDDPETRAKNAAQQKAEEKAQRKANREQNREQRAAEKAAEKAAHIKEREENDAALRDAYAKRQTQEKDMRDTREAQKALDEWDRREAAEQAAAEQAAKNEALAKQNAARDARRREIEEVFAEENRRRDERVATWLRKPGDNHGYNSWDSISWRRDQTRKFDRASKRRDASEKVKNAYGEAKNAFGEWRKDTIDDIKSDFNETRDGVKKAWNAGKKSLGNRIGSSAAAGDLYLRILRDRLSSGSGRNINPTEQVSNVSKPRTYHAQRYGDLMRRRTNTRHSDSSPFMTAFENAKNSDIRHYGVQGMKWGVINKSEMKGGRAGSLKRGYAAGNSAPSMQSYELRDEVDRMKLERDYRELKEYDATRAINQAKKVNEARTEKVMKIVGGVTATVAAANGVFNLVKNISGMKSKISEKRARKSQISIFDEADNK